MKLRIALALVLGAVALGLSAKVKCKVIITASEGAKPNELVVRKSADDGKDSPLRTKLEDGAYECEVETDQIELMTVSDFGQVMAEGSTSRLVDFLAEDGATIRIRFDGDELAAESDGPEARHMQQMEQLCREFLDRRIEEVGGKENLTPELNAALMEEFWQWRRDYYIANPMIAFLLDLSDRFANYGFNSSRLPADLEVYHKYYENLYPGHSAHAVIAEGEKAGYQIPGMQYHDYEAYDMDGNVVKASDYFAGKPTLVICWATWCVSCRREAIELIPAFEQYRERGLNAFSLAREFGSTDKLKEQVEADQYPWPCLYDLDDRFQIFKHHGCSSSALFLIDADGKIVAAGYDWSDLAPAADLLLGE